MKNTTVEQMLLTGFSLTLAVLLLVGAIAWNIVTPMAPFQSVDHTRQVMSTLDEMRFHVDRVESRQWGYFLTHEKKFLADRAEAVRALKPNFAELLVLTEDNGIQHALIEELQAAVDRRTALLDARLQLFEANGNSASSDQIAAGQAAATLVQDLTKRAEANEQVLLKARKSNELSRLMIIFGSIALLLVFLAFLTLRILRTIRTRTAEEKLALEARETLIKTGALQNAIFQSANFSSIATDAQGVIQIFNVGAERMLGYKAEEVMNKSTPADISDAGELVARAAALSQELNTPITPGFEALVFKASRGIEDIYELTYIRKDGSRFPAIVSVTALRDEQDKVIGYLLIGTGNTARKRVEAEQALLDKRFRDQQFYTRSLIESNIDAIMTTDPRGIISDVNQQMQELTGCSINSLPTPVGPMQPSAVC
jgi:PAS domain S-box-containing protein